MKRKKIIALKLVNKIILNKTFKKKKICHKNYV